MQSLQETIRTKGACDMLNYFNNITLFFMCAFAVYHCDSRSCSGATLFFGICGILVLVRIIFGNLAASARQDTNDKEVYLTLPERVKKQRKGMDDK